MATTPVLYGNRLYGRTLYSENFDPVTTTLTMSESVGLTDAITDTLDKVLTEMVSLTDAALKSINKPLADTTTISEALAISLAHALADTVAASDATIATTGTKPMADSIAFTESLITTFVKVLADTVDLMDSDQEFVTRTLTEAMTVQDSRIQATISIALTDILLLQDWLSLRLMKPNIWTVHVATVPVSSLYGRILFGRSLYSGMGGSSVPWNTQHITSPNNGWKSFNQLENQS